MNKITIFVFMICVLFSANSFAEKIFFVVHSENALEKLSTKDAKDIVLKNVKHWQNGEEIQVILPNGKTFPKIRGNFLNMSQFKWETYWGEKTLTSGTLPPKIISNNILILKNISKNPNVLGVLTQKRNLKNLNLKVLLEVEL